MIPKVLHYCWFGQGLMPQSQRDYIKGWHRLMPDWEIVRWNERNFPVDLCPYSIEAYHQKKWAFISDVARLWVLDNLGGVYLDTDIKLFSSLEPFLGCKAFTGFEWYYEDYETQDLRLLDSNGRPLNPETIIPCCGLLAGIIGATPSNRFIKECLDAYSNLNPKDNNGFVITNNLISKIAEKHGFCYQNKIQNLDEITVYPSEVFACEPHHYRDTTVALHCHTVHSWQPLTKKERINRWLDCHGLLKPYRLICNCFKRLHQ